MTCEPSASFRSVTADYRVLAEEGCSMLQVLIHESAPPLISASSSMMCPCILEECYVYRKLRPCRRISKFKGTRLFISLAVLSRPWSPTSSWLCLRASPAADMCARCSLSTSLSWQRTCQTARTAWQFLLGQCKSFANSSFGPVNGVAVCTL